MYTDATPDSKRQLRASARGWLINESARAKRMTGLIEPGDELVDVLDDLGDAENYERWIVSLAAQFLGDHVLEVGAGTGNLTRRIAEHHNVTAIEPHPALFAMLTENTAALATVERFEGHLTDLPNGDGYDSAFMANVLEHVDDDVGVLREMREAIRPGGHVAVFSPAFEPLYSDFDARVGHVRRYTRATLGKRFEQAGLEVVENRYVNLPGFFGWLLIARFLRQNPTDPKRVATYDKYVVPRLRKVENRISIPFGQSVLTVGRR